MKQGYYADCYVLSDKRTSTFIKSFLDNFLPNRQESAEDYVIPMHSDEPKIVFNTAIELIDYLTINTNEEHTVYWSNKDEADIKGAMCFFTNNGQVILGIYCDTMFPNTTIEDKVFEALKNFCGSSNGFITYEEAAPHDTTQFLERVKSANN